MIEPVMIISEAARRLGSVPSTVSSHHHHHPSLNCEGRWGTTDDFTTSFLHFSQFSTALWDLPNSRPVHSLMLSSQLFLCLPCFLPPFTVPCRMVLAAPDERETCPYHCSLRLFTMVRGSPCDPIASWILARTSSLVTWSLSCENFDQKINGLADQSASNSEAKALYHSDTDFL